jgi:hypothetical protein
VAKNGKYINPLKHQSMEGPTVSTSALAGFRKHAKTMLDKLHQVQLVMQQEAKSEHPEHAK